MKQCLFNFGKDNKKFKYSVIDKSANKRGYELALDWLKSSGLLFECRNLKKIETPLTPFEDIENFKMYLSDIGILCTLSNVKFSDILLDNEFSYKGAIAENFVAISFKVNKLNLNYWKNDNTAEIDYIIDTDESIIPIEVKSGSNLKSKSLDIYIKKYNPKYAIKLSQKNFKFNETVYNIPIYASFVIKGE